MNSSPLKCVSKLNEDSYFNEKLNDMSPVTDLALNLKSLKTTVTATPTRRISWSDPFKNTVTTKCSGEFSPCVDSPMLQEILMKNVQKCENNVSKKMLSLDGEDEKENVPPKRTIKSESMTSSSSESIVENYSQDSGYCGVSEKQFKSQTCGSTPRLKVRSSLFTNTNIEDLDGLFAMDCDIDTENVSGLNMESLLTKPLCNLEDSEDKKIKPSTRRCLTMEMEHSNDSPSIQLDFSDNNLQVSPMIEQSNCSSTDLMPLKRLPFKRPDPNTILAWQSKRRKSSPSVNFSTDIEDESYFIKQRSFSETATSIMQAVQKADLQPDLIGDCSRCYALPLVKGRHQDLKCISSETLVQVLRGEYSQNIDHYTLIDCRYPYEFEGGHIKGAQNIYTKEEIMETFLENVPESNNKNIIIFHCEFSSERAPNLCRFLRNKDREMNECNYPKLHHPEMYLLEGGYKAFFTNFREYCEPQDYKPMNHKDHSSDLRIFRAKSKSWGTDSKSRYKMKSASENNDI